MLMRTLLCAVAASAFVATPHIAFSQSKIGVASETKNHVEGIRGAEKRDLSPGSEVFLNELVRTGDESVAHLTFLDNTNLSVGPDSLVELDKFVYDPDRKIGQIVVDVSRGAFRFATAPGSSRNYTLRTPYATLGIRGTIFELVITNTDVKVKLNQGLIQVRTVSGEIVWLTRPETLVTIFPNGSVHGPIAYDAALTQFANQGKDATGTAGGSRSVGGLSDVLFTREFSRFIRSTTPGSPPGTDPSQATSTDNQANTQTQRTVFSKQKASIDELPISPTQ
jgi:hypothetical protein